MWKTKPRTVSVNFLGFQKGKKKKYSIIEVHEEKKTFFYSFLFLFL